MAEYAVSSLQRIGFEGVALRTGIQGLNMPIAIVLYTYEATNKIALGDSHAIVFKQQIQRLA